MTLKYCLTLLAFIFLILQNENEAERPYMDRVPWIYYLWCFSGWCFLTQESLGLPGFDGEALGAILSQGELSEWGPDSLLPTTRSPAPIVHTYSCSS